MTALDKTLKRDMQAVLDTEQGRRLVQVFLEEMGIYASPLRNTDSLTYHAIGGQDAGRWWLERIRSACPEREAQMRKELISYFKHLERNDDAIDE